MRSEEVWMGDDLLVESLLPT